LPGVTGACLLTRRDFFALLGGFDEGYAEECQDLDLCLEAAKRGFEVVYEPRSVLYHYENGTRVVRENLRDRGRFRARWAAFLETGVFRSDGQGRPWAREPAAPG
jgi:GT2 family glycosyltransferase